MGRSRIEWTDYTLNPVKGLCPVACDYCYARRMYKNPYYKAMYEHQEIRFEPIKDTDLPKKPSRIFVGSTMELFGEWVDAFWLDSIFKSVRDNPQHTFIFLTKRPQNALRFMGWQPEYQHHHRTANKLPDNVWMGVSITSHLDAPKARDFLLEKMAKVNFLSIEPLLGHFDRWGLSNVVRLADWVIIGRVTPYSPKTAPKLEWVREIVEAADKAGIPVFLKNNLLELVNYESPETAFAFNKEGYYRQEFPND